MKNLRKHLILKKSHWEKIKIKFFRKFFILSIICFICSVIMPIEQPSYTLKFLEKQFACQKTPHIIG